MNFAEVLRIRPFRNLWLGQAISQLGDAFYYIIFMFMVKKVTGSNAMVGYVGALETLPFLLFGPYGGVLADRIDRRKIMLWSDLASAAMLVVFAATIALAAKPPVWLLLVAPFVMSSFRCFFLPAKSAAIPALVPAELMIKANSLSSTTQNLMPMLGLSMSATVLGALWSLSPQWFYFAAVSINAVSFIVSGYYIWLMPEVLPERNDQHETKPMADFVAGIRFIRDRHDLKLLFVMITLFRLFVAPFFVVFLAVNEKWFGGKPQTLAWLEFAFFAGMIITSTAMANFKPRKPAKWFCLELIFIGITVGLMGVSPYILVFVLLNFLAGLAIAPGDIAINTYIQLSVVDAFRGRVNAALGLIGSGMMPIGMVLAGAMVERFGVEIGFFIMGGGMVAACMIGLLDSRLREVVMPGEDGQKTDEQVPSMA